MPFVECAEKYFPPMTREYVAALARETEKDKQIDHLKKELKVTEKALIRACMDLSDDDLGEPAIRAVSYLEKAKQADMGMGEEHICKTCSHRKGDCGIGIAGDTENAYFCYAETIKKVNLRDKCHNGKWQARGSGV